MWTYNISYGFGRKQDSKKLHKLTFCRCFFCSWILGEIGNLLRLLQAFSTQVHQSAPSLHDDCFRGSGAGCSSMRCHARLAAFPILIAADAMGDTSLHRASMVEYLVACGLRHPSERTQTTICALLTTICISWVPGLILDFSGGYVRFGYKRVFVWMQYHKKSNKRICVWWQEAMYVYVFDT